MADKNIEEGDKVCWNWGGAQPSGTVADIKSNGKLEIESKGKLVHKNADPSNPAVHVERSGNDVVKRASELTKIDSHDKGDDAESSAPGDKGATSTQEDKGTTSATDDREPSGKLASKEESSRKMSNTTAEVGDKREADEESGAGAAKKIKTSEAGEQKPKNPGRSRKGSKAKKSAVEREPEEYEKMAVEGQSEGTTASKKKGPGRPKKTDASDHVPNPVDGDVPAAHTRSKE